MLRREWSIREVPYTGCISDRVRLPCWPGFYQPTLEEASVNEFRVLDLPALGFPTSPMRGSRGIVWSENIRRENGRRGQLAEALTSVGCEREKKGPQPPAQPCPSIGVAVCRVSTRISNSERQHIFNHLEKSPNLRQL